MRKDAPLLLVLTLAILVPPRLAAESRMLYGKPADWETWGPEDNHASPTVVPSQTPALVAQSMETPNQKRRRLGLPIEASFPAPDYGQAEETPNQRRQRLAIEGQSGTTDSYVKELPDLDQDTANRLARAR